MRFLRVHFLGKKREHMRFGSVMIVWILVGTILSLPVSATQDLPKLAVWDLTAQNVSASYARILTSKLVSEVNHLRKYEVLSLDNVRALVGWTAERMKLGCNNTECLTALGQFDVTKLISGSVGKLGDTYSISLSLFDTQKARAENHVFEECRSENELSGLLQQAARKLLGITEARQTPPIQRPIEPAPAPLPPTVPQRNEFVSEGSWRPSKPIQLIVPFAAGGGTDIVARMTAKVVEKKFGQPVVVINKPGASGIIGAQSVANSTPDGYTLYFGYGSNADMILPHLQNLPYDPLRDLSPICQVSFDAIALVVRSGAPYKTLREFVEWGRTKGEITAGVPGKGSLADITLQAFGRASGLKIRTIPFAGAGPALTALLGNHVDCGGGDPIGIIPLIKDGKIDCMGIASDQRHPALSEVPTLRESGYDVTGSGTFKGIAAPKGTPPAVIQYLAFNLWKTCEDPEFIQPMKQLNQPVMFSWPEEFGRRVRNGYEQYGRLIRELGIQL